MRVTHQPLSMWYYRRRWWQQFYYFFKFHLSILMLALSPSPGRPKGLGVPYAGGGMAHTGTLCHWGWSGDCYHLPQNPFWISILSYCLHLWIVELLPSGLVILAVVEITLICNHLFSDFLLEPAVSAVLSLESSSNVHISPNPVGIFHHWCVRGKKVKTVCQTGLAQKI
jgi:hypothetical protein